MFSETADVRQIEGEPRRRWFADNDLELIVWFDERDGIIGFQLCYEIEKQPRALTWREGGGFDHSRIDEGESRERHHKATPILIPGGVFDRRVVERFAASSPGLPPEIAEFVMSKLVDYEAEAGEA